MEPWYCNHFVISLILLIISHFTKKRKWQKTTSKNSKRVVLSTRVVVVRNVDKAELQSILMSPSEIATKLLPEILQHVGPSDNPPAVFANTSCLTDLTF